MGPTAELAMIEFFVVCRQLVLKPKQSEHGN